MSWKDRAQEVDPEPKPKGGAWLDRAEPVEHTDWKARADVPEHSVLDTIMRSAAEGGTGGYADEIAGAGSAADHYGQNLQHLLNSEIPKSPHASGSEAYGKAQGEFEREYEAGRAANPKTAFVSELLGSAAPLALGGAPASLAGRLALSGGLGAVSGSGHADSGKRIKGGLIGGAAGLAGGLLGEGMAAGGRAAADTRVGQYLASKYGASKAAFIADKTKPLQQAVASARGELGGVSSAGKRVIDNLSEEGAAGVLPGADAYKALANSPEALALRHSVAENAADAFPHQMGRINQAREGLSAAKQTLDSGLRSATESPYSALGKDVAGATWDWAKDRASKLVPQPIKEAAGGASHVPMMAVWDALRSAPEKLGNAGRALTEAASRGPEALKVTTFLLANHPDSSGLRDTLSDKEPSVKRPQY